MRRIGDVAKKTWLTNSQLIIFIEDLFNSIASTAKWWLKCSSLRKNISMQALNWPEPFEKHPNPARNSARPEKPGPIYNSVLECMLYFCITAAYIVQA